jgi:glycosyltransferase involved in cell wall biosynthesis
MEIPLEACKLLNNIKFDVVFFGPHREYYREKYSQDNVSFIPPIEHNQIPSLLAKYPLVIGQFSGALGMTELEAMSCGKPVISKWQFDSFYPEPAPVLSASSPEEVAELVKEHFDDMLLGQKSRNWIKQNHGIDVVTKKLISVYDSL